MPGFGAHKDFSQEVNCATRLDGSDNYNYSYTGLSDRVQQTVNGVTTTYVLDLNTGLTQVLSDGTDTYLYGLSRIGEEDTAWDYYLSDALGSVRQLADGSGDVLLAQTFEPYGEMWVSVGAGSSSYAFSGEYWDSYIQLIYLRSRYFAPTTGRFLTKDIWQGDYNRPLSLNGWNYVEANPINYTDPSGMISEDIQERERAERYVKYLRSYYIEIIQDWGYEDIVSPHGYYTGCYWHEGNWRTWKEIKTVYDAVVEIHDYLGNDFSKLFAIFGDRTVQIRRTLEPQYQILMGNHAGLVLPSWILGVDGVSLPNNTFDGSVEYSVYTVIHEFGHVMDLRAGMVWSLSMADFIGNINHNDYQSCLLRVSAIGRFICGNDAYTYDPKIEAAPGRVSKPYASNTIAEDWAEAFASTIYPHYWEGLKTQNPSGYNLIGMRRQTYVDVVLSQYP